MIYPTHKVREVPLPKGPSTLKLILLVWFSDFCFEQYVRASYDQYTVWYRWWGRCIRLEAYRDYKRYLVENKIRSRSWWYLVKNLP